VFDRIRYDADGRVRFHYVLVDFLCRPCGGRLQCATDAEDAAWAAGDDLRRYGVAGATIRIIEKAMARASAGWTSREVGLESKE
jgi:hypothetical protein